VDNSATRVAVAQHSFDAADGCRWTVREFGAQGGDLNGDSACLIFESEGAFRRVKTFPNDWLRLSPDALMRLSWQA
jgi:hypothetical protein